MSEKTPLSPRETPIPLKNLLPAKEYIEGLTKHNKPDLMIRSVLFMAIDQFGWSVISSLPDAEE